ncbi:MULTISPECIES: hypothetical protein [unclassified Arthrobacter]|uniref:hypothetical protein n=1 Tax=unclassified Arthrobacter TaxID=235627 RepID=UPI0033969F2F
MSWAVLGGLSGGDEWHDAAEVAGCHQDHHDQQAQPGHVVAPPHLDEVQDQAGHHGGPEDQGKYQKQGTVQGVVRG